jgi:hypothetical protein
MSDTDIIEINYALNNQRTEATVEVAGTRFVVSAAQLEDVISKLGNLRSQMTPEVPAAPDNKKLLSVDLPSVHRLGENTNKGANVSFRSPGFGWFEVYLPQQWCLGLIAYLQGGNPDTPIDSPVKH